MEIENTINTNMGVNEMKTLMTLAVWTVLIALGMALVYNIMMMIGGMDVSPFVRDMFAIIGIAL